MSALKSDCSTKLFFMKRITMFILCFAFGWSALSAQFQVTGQVTSAEDGIPLPGVSVTVKGTTTGTITDLNGKYQINVPGNENVLVLSFVGLLTQEVEVNGRSSIDVTMESDLLEIDEVVDGMPIASQKAFVEDVSSGTNPSSRIVDLNPEDIESISVLKGATASALYGLRAANGVVVITTKSGAGVRKSGKKTLVTINSSFSSDRISRLPDLQSTYAQGNGGQLGLLSSGSWGPRIDTLQTYHSQEDNIFLDNPYETLDGSPPTNVPTVYNNQEEFFKTGYTFTNSVDISSATENAHYSVGFGRTDQEGIIETTGMVRNNAKFNGNFNLSLCFCKCLLSGSGQDTRGK
jgi:TonB-dependent SusC/RagA subfamily outer membrane receptor